MSGYWVSLYHENGRRMGAFSFFVIHADAEHEIQTAFANPQCSMGIIWQRDESGFGAGKWRAVQHVHRPFTPPSAPDRATCSDLEWSLWLEESSRRNGRGS